MFVVMNQVRSQIFAGFLGVRDALVPIACLVQLQNGVKPVLSERDLGDMIVEPNVPYSDV